MSDAMHTRQKRAADRKASDTHANVRYFKLLEVAYNCARNGYYERSRNLAAQAVHHYDETELEDTMEFEYGDSE